MMPSFRRLDRYGEFAIAIVSRAEEAARKRGHGYVGTEHLLLAMMSFEIQHAGGPFGTLGTDLRAMQTNLETILARWSGQHEVASKIPLTTRATIALRHADREATRWGDGELTADALLIGLMLARGGIAAHVLENAGLVVDDLRDAATRRRRK